CECDRAGSTSDVCDALTGQCPCRSGITGLRCDRCDRGTEGVLPNCVPCGECWNNWDKAIDNVINELDRLQNQTSQQLPRELKILFDSLVSLLDQIENLPWMTTEDARLNEFRDMLKRTEDTVMRLSSLDQFTDSLAKWDDLMTERLAEQMDRRARVNEMKKRLEVLTEQLKGVMDEATGLEHLDQKGAYLSILRSNDIANRVKGIQTSIEYQRSGFQGELVNSKRELEAVQTRADQMNADWTQLDRRIGEFQLNLHTGLISTCGINPGCNASNAGRLNIRMEEYLNLQIRLTNALHNVYRAESVISKSEIYSSTGDLLVGDNDLVSLDFPYNSRLSL
ncbi:unnamed protein product, partial [Trichobilharzia regenti]